jgi:hypothetical protein
MFALVSNAIQSAADVVSPSPSVLDQFVWHWNRIQDFYLDERSKDRVRRARDRLIEDTSIPRHLNEIMRLLLEEDAQLQQDEQINRVTNTQLSIGPCLEYVLQHHLLEMLCTLAEADEPPGTCLHVFLFLKRLIADCSVNLLGHNSLLNSVQRLIAMCTSAIAGPYERAQTEFLAIITLRLQTHRHLIQGFARDGFPLCIALLSLLTSPDNHVSTEAADMLIVMVSMADSELSQLMITEVPFTERLIQLLRDMYRAIPDHLRIFDVEQLLSSLPELNDSLAKTSLISNDARKFLGFMRWFCFYDTLVQRCQSSSLADALCSGFERQFLQHLVRSKFVDSQSIDNSALQTFILIHCVRNCVSSLLLKTIYRFVLDSDQVQQLLFTRCLSESTENEEITCIQSLQLLEELINKADHELIDRLLIQPIVHRSYIDIQLYNLNADLIELESSFQEQTSEKEGENQSADCIDGSVQRSETITLDVTKIKSLNYFIDLIPEELRSGPPAPDFGLQTYIEDAKKYFDQKLVKCSNWNWPKSFTRSPPATTIPFYEGDLLNMCFKNLQQLTRLSYETTLQVFY